MISNTKQPYPRSALPDPWFWATASTLWLLVLLFINPTGNFPLNDDWAYARTVLRFLETGRYDPGDWPAMTLWLHVLWGVAFSKIFGFSFFVLRLSTLLLAWIGALLFYRFCCQLTHRRWWSRVAFLTLVFNPFFFSLSLTFMTDIFFLVISLAVLFVYRRALIHHRLGDWVLATLLAAAAVLIRQLALVLPLAFGVVLVCQKRNGRSILLAAGSLGLCWAVLQTFTHWLSLNPGLPASFGQLSDLLPHLQPAIIGRELQKYSGVFLFYGAIFALPLLSLLSYQVGSWRYRVVAWLLSTGLALGCAVSAWQILPIENLWYDLGLGPVTLASAYRDYWMTWQGPSWIWDAIRATGFAGGSLLLFQLIARLRRAVGSIAGWSGQQWWKFGLVLFLAAYHLFLLIHEHRFDRYFLQIQPVWILLLSSEELPAPPLPLWRKVISGGLLLLMAFYSIAGTYDYFAWNRVRWQILRNLEKENGVKPGQIDGGFEYNAWHATAPKNPMGTNSKSWYFVAEDEYVVDFNRYDDCYPVMSAHPVPTLFFSKDSLLVLHRSPYTHFDTIHCDVEQLLAGGDRLTGAAGTHTFLTGGKIDDAIAHGGQYALLLTPEHPYGLTLRLAAAACEQLTISLWQRGTGPPADVVVSAADPEQFYTRPGALTDHREEGWRRTRHELRLPTSLSADTLLIYIWNPTSDSVWVDDLEIIRRGF